MEVKDKTKIKKTVPSGFKFKDSNVVSLKKKEKNSISKDKI